MSRRACTRPGGSPQREPPSHAQVEAQCSALAVNTAEEGLWPCTRGSTMLRAGDKQLRAASRPYQSQGAQSSVSAMCQGGAVHAPGAPPGGEPPSHVPVEAPCSALADDTAEEWLCQCISGSAMLRAGDKQLRATPRSCQPQGAQSSTPSPTAMPPLGKATHGGWARGLRSGHAQAHATQAGPPDLGVARPSRGFGEGRYGNCWNIKGDS